MSIVKYPVSDSSFKYVINVPGSVGTYFEKELDANAGLYELSLFSGASTTLEFYGQSGSVLETFTLTSAESYLTVFNEPIPSVLITHALASESVVTFTKVAGESFLANNVVIAEYTSSGSISVPADDYYVLVVGGGGGGAGGLGNTRSGGGGGSGGVLFVGPISLAGDETIVVGSAGTGGAADGSSGTDGGETNITISGSVFSASAGFGALQAVGGVAGSPDGGAGGAGRTTGGNGTNGSPSTKDLSPYSGTTGGGGGGSYRNSASTRTPGVGAGDGLIGRGGNGGSQFGGSGGAATGYGGGGGGGSISYASAGAGGNGSGGLIRIYAVL